MKISAISNFNILSFKGRPNRSNSKISDSQPDEFVLKAKEKRIATSNLYNRSVLACGLLSLLGGGAISISALSAPKYEFSPDISERTRDAVTEIIESKEANRFKSSEEAYFYKSEQDDTELSITRNKNELIINGNLKGEEINLKFKDNSENNNLQALFGLMVAVLSGFAARESLDNLNDNKREKEDIDFQRKLPKLLMDVDE